MRKEVTKLTTGVDSTEGIMQALDAALRDQHEGIVVDALKSPNMCDKRGNAYIKLKPDYVSSSAAAACTFCSPAKRT